MAIALKCLINCLGALYDAFGNATLSHELNTSWLLENSAEEFERLAKCLELDYDHYCYNFTSLYNNTEDETLDTLIMNNCVAGETTLGENIADLNGLHVRKNKNFRQELMNKEQIKLLNTRN